MEPAANYQSDVLVIGSGAAGLTTALQLADHHSVIIVSKGPLTEGSTYYAQGGIAAAMSNTDLEAHVNDTIEAGCGLSQPKIVEIVLFNQK